MAVLALNAATLVLDDELGLLPTSLLASSVHCVLLPLEHPQGPLSPILLDGPTAIGTGLD